MERNIERALQKYKDEAGRVGHPALQPPSHVRDTASLVAWLPVGKKALRSVRRKAEQDVAVAEAQIKAARPASTATDADWKRLDDAVKRLEGELLSPATLRQRMDEGRRSVLPKIDKMVQEHLEPTLVERGGRLSAQPNPDGLTALQEKLPGWIEGWFRYICGNIDADRSTLIEQLWNPRTGPLCQAPPDIANLKPKLPDPIKKPDFPTVVLERRLRGGVGSILRNTRSLLYMFISVGFIVGVNIRDVDWKESPGFLFLAFVVGLGALAVGVVQSLDEKAKEKERLADTARQKAEQAVRDTLRTWMERRADKIQQALKDQGTERHRALVRWYQDTVLPHLDRQRGQSKGRAAEAQTARTKLPQLKKNLSVVRRAVDAYEALAKVLEGAPTADGSAKSDGAVEPPTQVVGD